MKIVLVIPTLNLAGAEVMCSTLALELARKQVEVTVISMYHTETVLYERLRNANIVVKFLDKKQGKDLSVIEKLRKVLSDVKPDLIHSHLSILPYVILAAHLAGVKHCIHTVHNEADKDTVGIARILYRIAFKKFNVIPVALSTEIQASILTLYKLQAEQVPIIFNGIDLNGCLPKISYKQHENLTFIHVGRFAKEKNHAMLIAAFSEFTNKFAKSKLLLVGVGELFDEIKDLVDKYGISDKVEMLGERSDVPQLMYEADIFLLPSLYEGMPISIIEAMGTGLPIIATVVGGVPSLLQDKKTGLLINCNKEELVSAMTEFRDDKLREQCGQNAIKYANEKFSATAMCNSYYALYKSVVKE